MQTLLEAASQGQLEEGLHALYACAEPTARRRIGRWAAEDRTRKAPLSGEDLVSIGLVVGLDYRDTTLDVHVLLQRMKQHPLFKTYLAGGEMIEWGAKTIPEGGYYALPERRSGHGIVMVGDTAGFVDVPSLKGIHYAMQSGIYAARAIHQALKADDLSAERLAAYDRMPVPLHWRAGKAGLAVHKHRNHQQCGRDATLPD